ncbi:MAG: 3-oxoacyl-(acyl-carrier-protein) reductase [Thermoleophilia bacterium]|nr:3-oxoacyl-(acyl-carrier-protein) reductase [Thermoleophilia bacterium]
MSRPSPAVRTVLVTGASQGIGRACVDAFAARGWNVVATMRTPGEHAELARAGEDGRGGAVAVERLDVTDAASIESAFAAAVARFGAVDCVVNNAGYGLTGVFETMGEAQVARQVDTNLLGVLRVCRVAIAHMRPRRRGTIVNVTSMGGRLAFPLYSVYHATKFAVEGFSESLAYELAPLGLRVRIAEPGPVRTAFYGASMDHEAGAGLEEYADYTSRAMLKLNAAGAGGTSAEHVARVIVRAAESRGRRLRWPTDHRARTLIWLARVLPHPVLAALVRRSVA